MEPSFSFLFYSLLQRVDVCDKTLDLVVDQFALVSRHFVLTVRCHGYQVIVGHLLYVVRAERPGLRGFSCRSSSHPIRSMAHLALGFVESSCILSKARRSRCEQGYE